MKIGIWLLRHVEVEDHIDLFNIDTAPENVCGDHNTVLECLEVSVSLDTLILFQVTMNGDRGEVVLPEDGIEHLCALYTLHENYHLIELQRVEEVDQLLDLLLLLNLQVVLLKTVKGQLGLVINEDLELVAHELATDVLHISGHGG
jgi:hypothetical protein